MIAMSLRAKRDLVDCYNKMYGCPGPLVTELQAKFLSGAMPAAIVATYVLQCKYMIEARIPLQLSQSKNRSNEADK